MAGNSVVWATQEKNGPVRYSWGFQLRKVANQSCGEKGWENDGKAEGGKEQARNSKKGIDLPKMVRRKSLKRAWNVPVSVQILQAWMLPRLPWLRPKPASPRLLRRTRRVMWEWFFLFQALVRVRQDVLFFKNKGLPWPSTLLKPPFQAQF